MENKPVNLCKVTLTVSRMPKEVVFDVHRAIPSERKNIWIIEAIQAAKGVNIETLINPLIIAKSNLLKVDAAFNSSGIVCTTWCVERDLQKAKEYCIDKMEVSIMEELARATTMGRVWQEYRLKTNTK